MPADEEQYPPGLLAAGLDKIDFFIARAGEPALLLGQEFDFFDDRGLRRGFDELRRLHRLMGGHPRACRLAVDTGTHAYSPVNQRTMVGFFNEIVGRPPPAPDLLPMVPDEAQLQVTATRNVHAEGSRPMPEMVAEQARRLAAATPRVSPQELPATIRRALSIRVPRGLPHHRRLFQSGSKRAETGQNVFRFLVETEPGMPCVLRHVCRTGHPFRLNPGPSALLYLPDLSGQAELERPGTLAGHGDFWTLDPRGLGESLHSPTDPFELYGHDYMMTGYALMYNESLLGARVADVLAAIRLLRSEGAKDVRLAGRRQGALLVLLAAALDPAVASVSCEDAPESFLALASAPFTFWPAVNFPPGVLRRFDLPDVRAALGRRLVLDTRADPSAFERKTP